MREIRYLQIGGWEIWNMEMTWKKWEVMPL